MSRSRPPVRNAAPVFAGLIAGAALAMGGAPCLDAASIRDGNFSGWVGGMPVVKADTYGKTAYLYSYCQW
jgi:hypothetical protein